MRGKHAKPLEVQQGVWISEESLREAGLGQKVEMLIGPQEIRIVASVSGVVQKQGRPSERGVERLRALGIDAAPGRLRDAARDHDKYLYGEEG